MKKAGILLLSACLALLLAFPAGGTDYKAVNIVVGGAPLAAAGYLDGGVTMVPLRALAEALGFSVSWDQASRTASVHPGGDPAARPLVVLDPGHGGGMTGASYDGVAEKDLNLAIAKAAAGYLAQAGIDVLLTREDDRDVGLYERTELANSRSAALFVSIHCNASLTNPAARGIYTAAFGEGTEGWRASEALRQAVAGRTGAADLGGEARPDLAVLRTAEMPAALVECGFMSTPEELSLLGDAAYQALLAQGIAEGVARFLATGA